MSAKAPESETEIQAFERLAGQRVGVVIDKVKLLARMGATCPSDAHVAKAFDEIRAEVNAAEAAWRKKANKTVFSF